MVTFAHAHLSHPTPHSTADRLHADPYLAYSLLLTFKRSRFLGALVPTAEEVRVRVRVECVYVNCGVDVDVCVGVGVCVCVCGWVCG